MEVGGYKAVVPHLYDVFLNDRRRRMSRRVMIGVNNKLRSGGNIFSWLYASPKGERGGLCVKKRNSKTGLGEAGYSRYVYPGRNRMLRHSKETQRERYLIRMEVVYGHRDQHESLSGFLRGLTEYSNQQILIEDVGPEVIRA